MQLQRSLKDFHQGKFTACDVTKKTTGTCTCSILIGSYEISTTSLNGQKESQSQLRHILCTLDLRFFLHNIYKAAASSAERF